MQQDPLEKCFQNISRNSSLHPPYPPFPGAMLSILFINEVNFFFLIINEILIYIVHIYLNINHYPYNNLDYTLSK